MITLDKLTDKEILREAAEMLGGLYFNGRLFYKDGHSVKFNSLEDANDANMLRDKLLSMGIIMEELFTHGYTINLWPCKKSYKEHSRSGRRKHIDRIRTIAYIETFRKVEK